MTIADLALAALTLFNSLRFLAHIDRNITGAASCKPTLEAPAHAPLRTPTLTE